MYDLRLQAGPKNGSKLSLAKDKGNEKGIVSLLSLGFTKDQAERALRITHGNIERAANWLLQ